MLPAWFAPGNSDTIPIRRVQSAPHDYFNATAVQLHCSYCKIWRSMRDTSSSILFVSPIYFILIWAFMMGAVSWATVLLDFHTAPAIVIHSIFRWDQAYIDDTGSWSLNQKSTLLMPGDALLCPRCTRIHIWSYRTSKFTMISLWSSTRFLEKHLYGMFQTRDISLSIFLPVITLSLLHICIMHPLANQSLTVSLFWNHNPFLAAALISCKSWSFYGPPCDNMGTSYWWPRRFTTTLSLSRFWKMA